jgi:UDP-N-acetylglucosamine:LPS N-acetylglucosamine transferase
MKKVLIFTASFGEGHNTAAKNLKAGFLHVAPHDVDVEIVDLFKLANPKASERWGKRYLDVINKTPLVWYVFYLILHHTYVIQKNLWGFQRFIVILDDLIHQKQPDIICSTYPLYTYLFQKMPRLKKMKPFKEINIVTDSITINSLWYRGYNELSIVPNEDTEEVLMRAKVPPEKILALGFPVQLDFALAGEDQFAPPPDENNPPKILYVANSQKEHAPKILAQFLEADPNWKITIITGRDTKLLDELKKVSGSDRVQLVGWTDSMPKLLMSHHLVITKAGGAMVQESIAARCPTILNYVVPGQEEGNRELLVKNNCGAFVKSPTEIVPKIQSVFADDAKLWKEWKVNLEKISKPKASLKIADFLLHL